MCLGNSGQQSSDASSVQLLSGTPEAKTKGSSKPFVRFVVKSETGHIFTNIQCVPSPFCHPAEDRTGRQEEMVTYWTFIKYNSMSNRFSIFLFVLLTIIKASIYGVLICASHCSKYCFTLTYFIFYMLCDSKDNWLQSHILKLRSLTQAYVIISSYFIYLKWVRCHSPPNNGYYYHLPLQVGN